MAKNAAKATGSKKEWILHKNQFVLNVFLIILRLCRSRRLRDPWSPPPAFPLFHLITIRSHPGKRSDNLAYHNKNPSCEEIRDVILWGGLLMPLIRHKNGARILIRTTKMMSGMTKIGLVHPYVTQDNGAIWFQVCPEFTQISQTVPTKTKMKVSGSGAEPQRRRRRRSRI